MLAVLVQETLNLHANELKQHGVSTYFHGCEPGCKTQKRFKHLIQFF